MILPSYPDLTVPYPDPIQPRLGYNDITAEGASALASLLFAGSSSALERLELQGNHIGDAGAVALANGLAGRGGAAANAAAAAPGGGSKRRNRRGGAKQGATPPGPGLRSLNLAGNGIGCAGGVALAQALLTGGRKRTGGGGEGCVLEELELAGNAVSSSSFLFFTPECLLFFGPSWLELLSWK